ncbi:MAG: ribosome maturation factor RimP [Bacillota bacterium]
MSVGNGIVGMVEEIAAPLVEELGLELVDVQFRKEEGRWFLRVFIDNPGGEVGLGDCETVSVPLGRLLDERNVIPQAYFLEVSTPGVERVLKKPSDFRRFTDREVLVVTHKPLQGRRKFTGKIISSGEDAVRLMIEGTTIEIPFADISRANLIFKM